jgi:hypothetical protein
VTSYSSGCEPRDLAGIEKHRTNPVRGDTSWIPDMLHKSPLCYDLFRIPERRKGGGQDDVSTLLGRHIYPISITGSLRQHYASQAQC